MNEDNSKQKSHIFLSIGSNINSITNSLLAIKKLVRHPAMTVIKCSRFYLTKALDNNNEIDLNQPNYLNFALKIKSDLPLDDLKSQVFKNIETSLGRKRKKDKFGPRTIDIDIINLESLKEPNKHFYYITKPINDLITNRSQYDEKTKGKSSKQYIKLHPRNQELTRKANQIIESEN